MIASVNWPPRELQRLARTQGDDVSGLGSKLGEQQRCRFESTVRAI